MFLVRLRAFRLYTRKQAYECRRSKWKNQGNQAEVTTYQKSTPGSAAATVMKATYQQDILVFAPRDDCNMELPLASEPVKWTGDPACRLERNKRR